MRKFFALFLLASALACGGSSGGGITPPPPPPKPKPDPYVTVRLRNLMDTTTLAGRAHWHIYVMLTGTTAPINGVARQAAISLEDIRLHHNVVCLGVAADSIGQRLLQTFALADTTTSELSADKMADSVATAWYNGSHVLPAGWKALFILPVDAWDSQQYAAGHGMVPQDPIKWGWDWTAAGTTSFYERPSDGDATCGTFF